MFTKVAIASDHAGYELKNYILNKLDSNIVVNDFGTNSIESCDFPDYASKVCEYILENQDYRGILICGSGVGMSIAANKFAGIRAANVNDKATAIQSVEHNNVNVLSLGSNNINSEDAMDIDEATKDGKVKSTTPAEGKALDPKKQEMIGKQKRRMEQVAANGQNKQTTAEMQAKKAAANMNLSDSSSSEEDSDSD